MSESVHIVTVRLIKSFEYRTFKNLLMRDVDPQQTVAEFKENIRAAMKTASGMKPFLSVNYDTLKMYTKAHGSKTSNLIINLNHDDWIMDDEKTLADYGVENETELSFFNREAYETFKLDPEVKW
ncbi:hypothetical protein THASP1DRAFT_22168 [Thamnocephalis sphaerospora]|uniref:Uncharacterized protein n=1 Tax=Thamnocephalis sphaerospora TaxID=78915 RepID=A0A4P9XVK7_9FUNG|nr:hypothetical protein THASP1DRAFT_22168 [Thamnocephalis sphaerospora]|eukprot:RKP10062.1 hypothetical protein THASP1DRAFT_22168 [Thamnocephalis sphaerospora]